jgi:hypothetical protein
VYDVLTPCQIINDSLVNKFKIFNRSSICENELHYKYYINVDIPNGLHFEVDTKKKTVIVPELNEDGSKVIGKIAYSISFCSD